MSDPADLGKKDYDRATHTASEEPEAAWQQYFNQTYGPTIQGAREARPPIHQDTSPFARWLVTQVHRRDRVGALARVSVQDPTWPGGEDRKKLTEYFMKMGARQFVLASLSNAWDDFHKAQKREANKGKRQQQRQARKANRAAKRRKR